jgi:hypothetical protein
MESAFSITTTTNAISLDAAGQSAAVFTVNNQTGRSVRVRTDVSVFPPTPPDWFSIEGAGERLYPPGGAEVVTVRVAAGSAPAPGRYAFRLDALSVERPDEEWGHGPSVGFEVAVPPEPKDPPPPKVRRGYLETVLGALAGSILAVVVSVIIGVIVTSVAFPGIGTFLNIILRIYLLGGLTLGCALAGGLGAVVALGIRGIIDSAPWRTGLTFGVLATAGLTILEIALAKAIPFNFFDTSIGPFVATIVLTIIVIIPTALAGRAYARFRAGGKL